MQTYSVLIVEESAFMRRRISGLFEQDAQFRVAGTACSGREAVGLAGTLKPDLITMGIKLPEMDGVAALRQIMNEQPVPVVMLSNYAMEGSATTIEALQLGAADFFCKDLLQQIPPSRVLEQDFLLRCKAAVVNSKAGRSYWDKMLKQSIAAAQANSEQLSVLYIELDNYTIANASLSYEEGGRIIHTVVRRLQDTLQEEATVWCVSSRELICLLPGAEPEALLRKSASMLSRISEPIALEDREIGLSASMGISRFPDDGGDADELVRHATIANQQARKQGRNNSSLYHPTMDEKMRRRIAIERGLRTAIERNELTLHFQPQVDLWENRVTGMECLLRWNSAELGPVPPMTFIPVAEESGLILSIGEWVLWKACMQLKEWQAAGMPPSTLAVNLSTRQFSDPRLPDMIANILEETGIDPACLELEITESMTMNVDEALATLGKLKKLGLKIAMDDFGMGYSSLSYLKHLPIDKLKIDRSFIKEMAENAVDKAIVKTIVDMAASLRLTVVAEGVECEETARLLCKLGCAAAQGYWYSRPVKAESLPEVVERLGFVKAV